MTKIIQIPIMQNKLVLRTILHINSACLDDFSSIQEALPFQRFQPLPISGLIQQMTFENIFYFSQKIAFEISCKLSPKEIICKKCQNLFSWKN